MASLRALPVGTYGLLLATQVIAIAHRFHVPGNLRVDSNKNVGLFLRKP